MEIEAKYTTSDVIFAELLKSDALGDYHLGAAKQYHIIDIYLDTSDRDILKGGYACRMREKNGEWLLTVKGLGRSEGAIHRREEYEMEIQPDTIPQQWPDSPARDLVLSLTHSQPLCELCTIRQHRTKRLVYQCERCIGELSLDIVNMRSVGQQGKVYEVELELGRDGAVEDLQILDKLLRNCGLRPETRSKFERAMELVEV